MSNANPLLELLKDSHKEGVAWASANALRGIKEAIAMVEAGTVCTKVIARECGPNGEAPDATTFCDGPYLLLELPMPVVVTDEDREDAQAVVVAYFDSWRGKNFHGPADHSPMTKAAAQALAECRAKRAR